MSPHRPTDQTEITPEVPTPGHLKKLRTLIPLAESILAHARAVEVLYPDGERNDGGVGKVSIGDMKACASQRRALDKKLGALGVPLRGLPLGEFPDGTEEAARASGEFFVAIESACSALEGVNAAEIATIPRSQE